MTTGQKVAAQLDELDTVREGLIDALEDKGAILDPDAKLEDIIDAVEDLEVNDGYRYTKFGLSPLNKTSYIDYQDELNKIDFRNFGLDELFANSYLSNLPNFSNCKNINYVTTANKIFQKASLQGSSTSKPFVVSCLPSHLTSLNNAFESIANIDLTGASFPNIVSASKIFCFDNTSSKPTALNVINHEGSNFDNITNADYFYSNRQLTFYNQDLTKFVDTINGTSFTGTIYTLKNKTFQNLTSAQYFQFNYFMSTQKAVKIENCNFPNLVNLSYAFAGMSSNGSGSDIDNGITHFYIKNCTFGKPLNLTCLFHRKYALKSVTIDCENKIPVGNMSQTFSQLRYLNNWTFLDKFDVSGCSNFYYTFYGAPVVSLDLTSWNATASNIQYMFNSCNSLVSLKLPNLKILTNTSIGSGNVFQSNQLEHIDIRSMEWSKWNGGTMWSCPIGAPATCEIIVKDDAEKTWWNTKYPTFTNVKTAAEYEAEQGGAS